MTRKSSEISNQTGPSRYEIKMIFDGLQTAQVRSLIMAHSQLFKEAYPSRQVNNIYFDSEDFQLIQAHIQGSYHRSKLRLRWYGDTWKFSTSQYEIKSKTGNLGTKVIFPILTDVDLTEISWLQLQSLIQPFIDQNNQHIIKLTWPALINMYHREYFENAERSLRITLDSGVKSLGQTFGSHPNLRHFTPVRNVTILEVKADKSQSQLIADVLEEFPQYCEAYSKYIHGTETIPL